MKARFKRQGLVEGKWCIDENRFQVHTTNVKVGDIVVAEGTTGKYYEVLAIEPIPERELHHINFDMLLSIRFIGKAGIEKLIRKRAKPFRTSTGWYSIVTPVNEAIAKEVAELCKD